MEITRKHEHGPVDVRWVEGDEIMRRAVDPGQDISGLPDATRVEIEAHWTPARVAAWVATAAPEPVAPPTRWIVQKVTLIERMTDVEIATLRTFLAANGRRIERWRATVQVWSDDAQVRQLLEGLFGVGRADELLALE